MTRAERIEAALLALRPCNGENHPVVGPVYDYHVCVRMGGADAIINRLRRDALAPDAPVPADPAPTAPAWSPAVLRIIDQARKALLDAATDATFEERRKAWDLIRAAFFGPTAPDPIREAIAGGEPSGRACGHTREQHSQMHNLEYGPDCDRPAPLQSQEPQSLESVRMELYAIVSSMGQTKAWTIPELFTVLRDRIGALRDQSQEPANTHIAPCGSACLDHATKSASQSQQEPAPSTPDHAFVETCNCQGPAHPKDCPASMAYRLKSLSVAVWRVILWQRRVEYGFHPSEPGLTVLLKQLAAVAGECPVDVGIRGYEFAHPKGGDRPDTEELPVQRAQVGSATEPPVVVGPGASAHRGATAEKGERCDEGHESGGPQGWIPCGKAMPCSDRPLEPPVEGEEKRPKSKWPDDWITIEKRELALLTSEREALDMETSAGIEASEAAYRKRERALQARVESLERELRETKEALDSTTALRCLAHVTIPPILKEPGGEECGICIQVEADHEWAQWFEKWTATLDTLGNVSARLERERAAHQEEDWQARYEKLKLHGDQAIAQLEGENTILRSALARIGSGMCDRKALCGDTCADDRVPPNEGCLSCYANAKLAEAEGTR